MVLYVYNLCVSTKTSAIAIGMCEKNGNESCLASSFFFFFFFVDLEVPRSNVLRTNFRRFNVVV